ncbi:MAG: hypothetical protein KKB20_12065 [Proteobacteria bacterium]|nr:hypothetical protein [Pseudomonadota bacterium]
MLDCNNIDKLKEFIIERKIAYVSDVKARETDNIIIFIIPSEKISEKSTKNKTSKRQLTYLKKEIKNKFDIEVEYVIYREKNQEQIDAGLLALLAERFGKIIKDCLTSFKGSNSVDVWIDLSIKMEQSNRGLIDNIRGVISDYLNLFGISLRSLHGISQDQDVPSQIVILKVIKIISPAQQIDINNYLQGINYYIPSELWLSRKLDVLRKKMLILRQKDKSYVLTEEGVRFVPRTASSNSSDIKRALALGRKRWYI